MTEHRHDEKIYGRYTDPKRCPGCGESKPLSEFYTFRRASNGRLYYRARCKACDGQDATKWSQNNRDRRNENQRRVYGNKPDVIATRAERMAEWLQ